jgi:hypothetical protein
VHTETSTSVSSRLESAAPERRSRAVFAVVAVGAVVAYAGVSLVFVFRGRLNADEGWYLYAGRLVWRGHLPYRDFAFPQMPLTAYVYGLPQTLHASLTLGRLTSMVLGVAAVALLARVAWREAGPAAGAAVAVLLAAFPTGIYNLTITKTYALSAFLVAVVLTALTSGGRTTRTWPLATAAAIALLATRSTGLVLVLVVVGWCVLRAPNRSTRRNVAVVTLVGGGLLAVLLLLDVTAARYDLVTFHNLLWHGADPGSRLETIVRDRIPDWFGDYWGYAALLAGAVIAVCASRRVRGHLSRQPGLVLVGLGLVGALVAQLTTGEWAPVEYAAPLIPGLVTLAVIVLAIALRPDGGWTAHRGLAAVAALAVVALAVTTVFHPGAGEYFTGHTNPGSVDAADRVGDYLSDHTRADDEVLTLWAQPAGLASARDNVPGVTVGPFSYEDLSTPEALDLHYVNAELLAQTLREGRPAAVVLTGIDDLVFGFRGTFSDQHQDRRTILDALSSHYRLVRRDVGWGTDGPTPVRIYLRDDRR